MKKLASIAIAVMLVLGLMVPAFAAVDTASETQYKWVNCSDGYRLNVRNQPDTKSSKVLFRLDCGKRVEILADEKVPSGWSHIRADGKTGYVMTKFLQDKKPGKYEITERSDHFKAIEAYYVTTKPLNNKTTQSVCLRTKPNKTSRSIRRLEADEVLKVIEVGSTWSKVVDQVTGKTGYVANDYIMR